jgi:hypothetical protein
MGYVILGHGSIDVSDGDLAAPYQPGMGIVAIPPGTTLQCYSDAGQILVTSEGLVNLWSQLTAPWPPMNSDNVTYNLSLGVFEALESLEEVIRWGSLDTNGHELLVAGVSDLLRDNDLMCTGEVGQCPTDPRLKLQHKCDGILKRFAGHDLFWIACTSFALPGQAEATETGYDLAGTREAIAAARSAPIAVWGANPDDLVGSAKTYIQGLSSSDVAEGEQAFVVRLLSPLYRWDLTDEQRETLLNDEYLKEIVDRRRGELGL